MGFFRIYRFPSGAATSVLENACERKVYQPSRRGTSTFYERALSAAKPPKLPRQALTEFRALRERPKNLKMPEMVAALVILFWLLLLVVCWPLALAALLVLPILWFISIPFRIVFWAIEALLRLVKSILFLPLRILGLLGLAGRKS
jgi:hypothetical protein